MFEIISFEAENGPFSTAQTYATLKFPSYKDFEKFRNAYHIYKRHKENKIEKVIFNDPATIVFWTDGTKTVVKCSDGDLFDPEKRFGYGHL